MYSTLLLCGCWKCSVLDHRQVGAGYVVEVCCTDPDDLKPCWKSSWVCLGCGHHMCCVIVLSAWLSFNVLATDCTAVTRQIDSMDGDTSVGFCVALYAPQQISFCL